MGTKFRKKLSILATGVAMIGLSLASGCGGGGTGANVVTVSVSPTNGVTNLIVGQSTTLTATVSGANVTNVKWTPEFLGGTPPPPCQYTTTPTNSTTPSALTSCPTDGSFGTLTNLQDTGPSATATYTAPSTVPDPTKFPNLQIVITAQSQANTSKTGKVTLRIISGIGMALTPTTASVPTGEPQQFSVQLTNDLKNQGVTWAITQQLAGSNVTSSSSSTPPNPYFGLATCSPSCGTITPSTSTNTVALYTAPTTLPTAITPAEKGNTNPVTQLTIVATSVADNTSIAAGTITIVQGGPITFNSITPTIAPLGATFWDIYLDAPNVSSASSINITYPDGHTVVPKLSSSGQVKVLFPLPTTSTTTTNGVTTTTTVTGSPTGARLRLLAPDLVIPGSYVLSISDPAQKVTTPNPPAAYTYNVISVRPTTIASVPDDVIQGASGLGTPVVIDGGYFGSASSGNPLVNVTFQGNTLPINAGSSSASRLDVNLLQNFINAVSPGLYPLSVASRATPLPTPNNSSVTNIAIFPDYSSAPPVVVSGTNGIPAGTNPSAVDLDPTLGVLVVAETGSNAVQFYQIGSGTLTPIDSNGGVCAAGCPVAVGTLPTGLSVNRSNHTVAVVNYGSQTTTTTNSVTNACQITALTGQSVSVLNIPGNPAPITPFTVDLTGALQGSVCPAPMPFSIGVDPGSNLALIAYSSTPLSPAANLGFVVNLNANTQGSSGNLANPCALGLAIKPGSNQFGQCLYSQVTLNTGLYPQVATAANSHTALVTPGGSGVVRGVDVTSQSSGNVISSASLAASLVTVTIDTTKCPPPLPNPNPNATPPTNPCPFSMVPGNAGTVLITGLPKGSNGTDFNGTFTVAVLSSNTFEYALQSSVTDTVAGSCNPSGTPPTCSTVFYGTPEQIFALSPTLQGVAINPITSTAALADTNATGTNGAQIDLLNSLDQTVSSITFSSNCTAFITSCPTSPELLSTANVAWQPYTNELVSYNPHLNQVSISDPVTRQRYAFACASQSPCSANPINPGQVTLNGTGTATINVQNGTGTTTNPATLSLFGGLAVDPATNQAFVVKSGSGSIDIINLGVVNPVKPTHISQVIVPSPTPGRGFVGGIPNASVPQATLTSTTALSGVQIFGAGFASGLQVRLDGVDITTQGGSIDKIAPNGRQVDVTIPPFFLSAPHHYSLDVLSNGAPSNSLDFIVVQAIDMSKICTDSSGKPVNSMPTSVAVADQLANGPFSPIAVVSNQGCNSISVIDINPASKTFGQLVGSPIAVGTAPQGVAISQRRGLAVVTNNSSASASIIDLTKSPPVKAVPDVGTGTNPVGVAINDPTGVAITANFGSNTITAINFGLLFPPAGTTPPTTLSPQSIGGIQNPLAVAIDPDRGTNNQGIAVVTSLQLSSGQAPVGALAVVEIGFANPGPSTTIPSGTVSATPTGIVFDPAVVTAANPGVFFANSSGTNTISEFNPDTSSGSSVNVGVNPTSLAVNPQTGALLTSNSLSNTASVVDISSSPFKTRQTLGIPGSATSGVAIDQFTNLAVIVDQANQRVLLFPMPN